MINTLKTKLAAQRVSFNNRSTVIALTKWIGEKTEIEGPELDAKDPRIFHIVQYFERYLAFEKRRDKKNITFFLCDPSVTENKKALIENNQFFLAILQSIQSEKDNKPNLFRKCYQGLLHAYLVFPKYSKTLDEKTKQNWLLLRTFLEKNITSFSDSTDLNISWVNCLLEHKNLVQEDPTVRYQADLLNENTVELGRIREILHIPKESWFEQDLVLQYFKTIATLNHEQFQQKLERALKVLDENKILTDLGLKILLERYAEIDGSYTERHPLLYLVSLQAWGNPLLPTSDLLWRQVTGKTQDMVKNWLKDELMTLFFNVLSKDGNGEPRRLNFWKNYIKQIDMIYLAEGTDMRRNLYLKDYNALQEKGKGSILDLQATSSAFIMKMANFWFVEFGESGNALYVYESKNYPFDFAQSLQVRVDARNSLKNSEYIEKLSHTDSASGQWEQSFGAVIDRLLNFNSTDDFYDFNDLVKKCKATVSDKRSLGGQLSVRSANFSPAAQSKLQEWGFKYSTNKDMWWRK